MSHFILSSCTLDPLKIVRTLGSLPFVEMVLIVTTIVVLFSLFLIVANHLLIGKNKYTTSKEASLANVINSGIVGLILAFIVVSMYQTNRVAENSISKETSVLATIFNISQLLDNADQIQSAVKRYIEIVVQEEWPLMCSGDIDKIWNNPNVIIVDPHTKRAVGPFYKVFEQSHPQGIVQESFYYSVPRLLEKLTDARRERIGVADFHLPTQFWSVIILMTMILLWFVVYMNPWNGGHSLIPVMVVAIVIGLCLALLISLHYPFLGPFAVSAKPYCSGVLNFSQSPDPKLKK